MLELNEKELDIMKGFKHAEQMIREATSSKATPSQKKRAAMRISIIEDEIDVYSITLDNADIPDKTSLLKTLDGFKTQLKTLKEKLQSTGVTEPRTGGTLKPEDLEDLLKKVNICDMNKLQVMDLGDNLLNKALEKLKNVNTTLEQDNKLMNDVNQGLKAQSEKMQKIDESLKDTKSILKRANKEISSLFSSYYKDKFILVLCCVIILLVIVVIIVGIVRNKSTTSSTDTGTTNSTNTNTTTTNTTTTSTTVTNLAYGAIESSRQLISLGLGISGR